VSKIRLAIEPLAENVSPPVAFVLAVLVALDVLVALEVALPEVLPALPVLLGVGVVYCATAGARLNAAAKSPKTSTSATAIGAFFIAKSVQKSILTILSISSRSNLRSLDH
jgi:hypothetical protein